MSPYKMIQTQCANPSYNAPSHSHIFPIMIFIRFLLLVSSLTFFGAGAETPDELCLAQGDAIRNNTKIKRAYAQLAKANEQEMANCIASGQSACDVTSDSEQATIQGVCENAGYDFDVVDVDLVCKENKDVILQMTIQYMACQGLNCSAEFIENAWEESLDNATKIINQQMPSGISCNYDLAGAGSSAASELVRIATATLVLMFGMLAAFARD